jgi:hypothetical protein
MSRFAHTVVIYGVPHIYEVDAPSPAAALGRLSDSVHPNHGNPLEPTNKVAQFVSQNVSTVPKGH